MEQQIIELKLTLEEANLVLKGLGKLPAEESMKVIQSIVTQGNAQMPEPSQTPQAPQTEEAKEIKSK